MPSTTQRHFSQPRVTLLYALGFIILVIILFTIGYRLAGWSWSDSLYMVVITAFSVGYGEVRPVDTNGLRVLTAALIFLGCTGIIFVTGSLVQWLTEAQIQRVLGGRRMQHEIERLRNHIIICGYGRIGRMLASQLREGAASFVVIDIDPERITEAHEDGSLTLHGEATDEGILRAAGITRAKVLATVLPNDASNVFITLSARNLNPAIRIIARGEVPTTEKKLLQAGADRVVLPAHIGADHIAHLILHPNATELLDRQSPDGRELENHLGSLGLRLEEIEIGPESGFANRPVGEVERDAGGRIITVAIQRKEGGTDVSPPPTATLFPGDALVVLRRVGRE
ncbi:MAG: NAD-binding protein [Verrucomicrobia bacterium]|nr:NAD-binding protein [Verrucomicrobiota bacterium]